MTDHTHYSEISKLKFYILDSDENFIDSSVSVTNKELFKNDLPLPDSVYSPHMGTTDHSWKCQTCFNIKNVCPGHFGSIDLRYPVKSPLFRDTILKWLKIVCFKCGSLLYDKDFKAPKAKLLAEYVKLSRDIHKCSSCEEYHPTVKKDKFEQATFYAEYPTDIGNKFRKQELFNNEISDILYRIPNEVVLKVGKPLESHPNKLILNIIRVAPNTIRPDIRKIGGNRSNNSDITALTKNIIEINSLLPIEIPDKHEINKNLREMYFNLDMTYYELVKGSSSTNNQVRMITSTNKTPNSIAQRIPKKNGRVRKNLMGKRVRQMARSVISGDPYLKVDEIGIPMSIATSLQIPETVRSYNKDRLNIYFMNKTALYPGCSGIINGKTKKFYRIENLDPNYELQEGDIIMRNIIDGDFVGFNRQPSLLFSNISAHRVVVLDKGETFRMNVSACSAFNADSTTVGV